MDEARDDDHHHSEDINLNRFFFSAQAAFCVGFPEDLRYGFPNRSAYWRTTVVFGVKQRKAAFTRQTKVCKLVLANFKKLANSCLHTSNSRQLKTHFFLTSSAVEKKMLKRVHLFNKQSFSQNTFLLYQIRKLLVSSCTLQ